MLDIATANSLMKLTRANLLKKLGNTGSTKTRIEYFLIERSDELSWHDRHEASWARSYANRYDGWREHADRFSVDPSSTKMR